MNDDDDSLGSPSPNPLSPIKNAFKQNSTSPFVINNMHDKPKPPELIVLLSNGSSP